MTTAELHFTQDWVTRHVPAWTHLMRYLPRRKKFLEIGSFEGRSACWFLEHALDADGELYCVDTWEGNPEFRFLADQGENAEALFAANIAMAKKPDQQVHVVRDCSAAALARMITEGLDNTFDVIYVDGSHRAPDVLTDACLSWRLIRSGGMVMFDDYLFNLHLDAEMRPKVAIDAFLLAFHSQLETLVVGDQYVVRKR